jgi:hypothetical protein
MNIVETILEKKKKYIILISSYLWWSDLKPIVDALANNLQFEVIYVNQLVPDTMLITSSDQINFPVLNELIKEKLDKDKYNGINRGYIIVGYSFPPERLDFYPDININITANQVFITSLIVKLMNDIKINRLKVDEHLSYLTKSWKSNNIARNIQFPPNYAEKINELYGMIFDTIMDNIMKKVYGEKYEEYKNTNSITEIKKLPEPRKEENMINVADESKMYIKDIVTINSGVKTGEFIDDLDDVIITTDTENSSNNSDDDSDDDSIGGNSTDQSESSMYSYSINNSIQEDDINIKTLENNLDSELSINHVKRELEAGSKPYYIGRR